MDFAKRTEWDLSANAVSGCVAQLKQSGRPWFDLTVSNPTQCALMCPEENLLAGFHQPENAYYDPAPFGLDHTRDAVALYYRDQGYSVPADRIALTASTSEAYGFLFQLLTDPQARVAFPKPSYPLFEFLAGLHDLEWSTYRLTYRDRWCLDRDSFRGCLDAGARAVILVNPNNPTGSCLTSEDARYVADECRKYDVAVICDEVFLDYVYPDGEKAVSWVTCDAPLTFVLGGLSKSFALPQMKLSWIVVNGPPIQVQAAMKRLEVIADTYLSVNTPVQHAFPRWLDLGKDMRARVLDRVWRNRQFLEQQCVLLENRCLVLNAQGGWSAMLHVREIHDEEVFVLDLLKNHQTYVHPGYFFDCEDTGFLVVSLLPKEDIFQEGVRRLMAAVRSLS